jgi:uncharacterized tellurite resistance protein B-like protein
VSILEFFGFDRKKAASAARGAETETVREIAEALDRLEPERARFLAAFAYLLGRVAHADLEISAEESRSMRDHVRDEGGLSGDQAALVVEIAKSRNLLFGGTENFLVSREFERMADRGQKMGLLRCLFAVSAADESISVAEDNEIRRIANELKLEHRDFIAARTAWRQHLAVLRRGGETG